MADATNELMLEQFRQIRTILGVHGQKLDELLHRVSTLEIGVAGLRRDHAADADARAHLQARVDRMQGQIDRINRRLEIDDPQP